MRLKVLAKADVEQFLELGYVKVEEAYARKDALRVQDHLWGKLEAYGVDREDRRTWQEPMVHIRETYDDEVFQVCNTARLADAIEDLAGEGRVAERVVYGESSVKTRWGWWPVNFASGADREWSVPTNGWHWDGIQFRHFVDSPDQGLLCLCLFSDIAPRGGGTLVAEGSFRPIARHLSQYKDGVELKDGVRTLNETHPWFGALTGAGEEGGSNASARDRIAQFMEQAFTEPDGGKLRVVETTGTAGDVFLCHPFLYHAASQNHSGVPRFMCNRTSPLKERLNFRRPQAEDYSPLELSIKQALENS